MLVAGERGGSFAGSVFWGLGIGGVYTWLMNSMQMWPGQPEYQPKWLPGASFRAAITSEYLGVGYIIGPKTAGTIFAGGVFSWLVLMPAIRFFGQNLTGAALSLDDSHFADDARPNVVQLRSSDRRGRRGRGRIDHADANAADNFERAHRGIEGCARPARRHGARKPDRLERDLPMKFVLIGSVVIIAMMWALLTFKPIPGASTGLFANLMAALLVIVFGFLFVTVSCRICGLIGNVVESGQRHDHRDADGHLRDVSGDGLDGRRVRRAGDHDWRRRRASPRRMPARLRRT